jgi:predicted polyphosphate/ATP-dependent NAD kinase
MTSVSDVGIIVNPWAGKDIRRLHAPVGHSPDTAKIGIVRRIAIGALEAGALRVIATRDTGRIAERAVVGIDRALLVDGPGTGSALDSRRGATQLADLGCAPIVVLGGDGTCRDVAVGAPDATMIAISTGTNNVFPVMIDGSSAGTAAGLIATGAIALGAVGRRAKVLHVEIQRPGHVPEHDIALVDVALTDDGHTGARAVVRSESLRAVVAAIASPTSTGLSAIAGRVFPISRHVPGAVVVHLQGDRTIRVPIVPGAFHDVSIGAIDLLADGESVQLSGPGTLAYDGERHRVLTADAVATITVRCDGPTVVDVDRALHCAAQQHLFDLPSGNNPRHTTSEAHNGD